MGLLLDIHVHTQRHSMCSHIDEHLLIQRAVRAGLDGIVLTEHHYQWSNEELDALRRESGVPGFILLAGFECTTEKGDILIYGLESGQTALFAPGGDPERTLQHAQALGALCIAAHPTRSLMGFDERIARMPFDGIEVKSVNLKPHEQQLAAKLATSVGLRPVAASDAHRIEAVGAYSMEFDGLIQSMADLQHAIRSGQFRIPGKQS